MIPPPPRSTLFPYTTLFRSLIWTAIEKKRLLRFRYKNRERIVEPHGYGIHKGLIKLFGYQVAGSSSQKLRSEEHTSELQSRFDLVCRLLLEKKKRLETFSYP